MQIVFVSNICRAGRSPFKGDRPGPGLSRTNPERLHDAQHVLRVPLPSAAHPMLHSHLGSSLTAISLQLLRRHLVLVFLVIMPNKDELSRWLGTLLDFMDHMPSHWGGVTGGPITKERFRFCRARAAPSGRETLQRGGGRSPLFSF